jgi:hypothetical protein
MTWVRLSDTWWRDARALRLSAAARDLFIRLLTWAGGENSDGHLPAAAVELVALGPAEVALEELLAGHFIAAAPGGWTVEHWEDFLLPAALVDQRRQQRAAAGRAGGFRGAGRSRDPHGRYLARPRPSDELGSPPSERPAP